MPVKSFEEIMAAVTGGSSDAATQTESAQTKPPTDKKRDRNRKKGKAKVTRVPARIEPGWIHYEIANAVLRWIQQSFAITVDDQPVPFDVGAPAEIPGGENPEEIEDREPAELMARLIAHVFYRTPGLKRVEKRLEGQEAKSGILSDFVALLAQIARRNKHLVPVFIDYVREEMQKGAIRAKEKKAAARATKGGNATDNGAGIGTVDLSETRGG